MTFSICSFTYLALGQLFKKNAACKIFWRKLFFLSLRCVIKIANIAKTFTQAISKFSMLWIRVLYMQVSSLVLLSLYVYVCANIILNCYTFVIIYTCTCYILLVYFHYDFSQRYWSTMHDLATLSYHLVNYAVIRNS